ncbi:gluconate 2-dehydrogenase subunit 3 family protein [Tsukamurella soli]|uniref:Tetracyclin repressor-like C-terminal domain-containing protein n=1 Tax=Tsukamurella soli TaxID=644556 RepID=A0ABP8K4Q6_9ACTN
MLDSEQRRTFAVLADILIPGTDTMPSATAAGITAHLVDRALGYRPDLVAEFSQALADCSCGAPESALDVLSTEQPGRFAALTVIASGAYFLSPRVARAMPYAAAPRAVREDIDTYADILEHVVDRGFTIR